MITYLLMTRRSRGFFFSPLHARTIIEHVILRVVNDERHHSLDHNLIICKRIPKRNKCIVNKRCQAMPHYRLKPPHVYLAVYLGNEKITFGRFDSAAHKQAGSGYDMLAVRALSDDHPNRRICV